MTANPSYSGRADHPGARFSRPGASNDSSVAQCDCGNGDFCSSAWKWRAASASAARMYIMLPGTHMMTPPYIWSSSTEIPHKRGTVV